MNFTDLLRKILIDCPKGMTPQQVREEIKMRYPDFYGTESHKRNVEKGHYKDIDHALLAQIYVASRNVSDINVDKTQKPLQLSWLHEPEGNNLVLNEDIESENLERLEANVGTLYVLGTNLFTKDGAEIIKIGITTGKVDVRINQLFTTGVPFRFRIISQMDTKNYSELEQSIHKLLDPYRVNKSREFFTEKCLPYIDRVVAIHKEIQHEV